MQSGLNLFLRLFLRSPFIVFGSIVMAFIVSPKAAVIFVVTIPLLSIVVFGIMLITMPLYRKVQGSLDGILGVTRENLTGVRVIRAFGREEQEKDRFEENNGLLVRSQLLVGKISALMNPLTYVMINLAVVVILNTGAVQIHLGNMQQGDVVALVNYMNQILIELGQAGKPDHSGDKSNGVCRACCFCSERRAGNGVFLSGKQCKKQKNRHFR